MQPAQTDDVLEWPVPVWPASRLQESQQILLENPGDIVQRTLASIRMQAASGDLAGAREQLAVLRESLGGRDTASGNLRQIIPIALMIHDQASALHFLSAMFPTTVPVGFALTAATDHSVVSMRIERRSVTFILSVFIFSDDHGEVLLQRLVDVYPILAYYFESSLCANGSVAVNLGDAGHVPGLAFCDNRPGYFLVPDSIFMDTRGYISMRRHYAEQPVPWAARAPIAFWRGSTTGQPSDPRLGWRSLPRVRLCEIGAGHPDLIDAGITKVAQITDPAAAAWMADAGLLRPHVPAESFQEYKYQIDIDGNTNSWPGLFMKLLTGSVVLKVPPRDGFEQWYYDRLKPWVNYVPLTPDMADLADKVRWLRANDRAAEMIGEAGFRLADELTYEREIGRAAPTVAAALKDAAGLPVLHVDFAVGGAGAACLREGWLPPEHDGVDSTGYQSRVDLPRPCGIGGFILGLEVSPARRESQGLSVAVDGELRKQLRLAGRTTLYVPLARKALANKARANKLPIELTLLHPDATPLASAGYPGDARLPGVRLHRIFAMSSRAYDPNGPAEYAEALLELKALDDEDRPHDLNGPIPALPPRTRLVPLYTHHGTLVYADIATGRLRHGAADVAPRNVLLAVSGNDGILVRVSQANGLRTVRLRPEGRLAGEADPLALTPDGHADRFALTPADDNPGPAVALQAAGLVLCAETSGDLEFGRLKIGPWEQFRPAP